MISAVSILMTGSGFHAHKRGLQSDARPRGLTRTRTLARTPILPRHELAPCLTPGSANPDGLVKTNTDEDKDYDKDKDQDRKDEPRKEVDLTPLLRFGILACRVALDQADEHSDDLLKALLAGTNWFGVNFALATRMSSPAAYSSADP